MKAGTLFSLEGRVVMVTGASSGLGARFAAVAAANGAKVVLVGRRTDRLNEVKAEIEDAGGSAFVATADVTDAEALNATFEAAERAYGIVDVLIANAGTVIWEKPMEVTPKTWREVMTTNLDAVFWWSQEAARRMIDAGRGGSIVTISSIAGLKVSGAFAPYGIAKTALIAATKLLAQELGPHGIRVNTIAPGWVMSEMTSGYLHSPEGEADMSGLPLRRHGDPADLDGPFLLLASDAGRLMTGATIVVDAGNMVR
jgi:3-oxoacyl-[acyl-carrier protein] reductase